MMNAEQLALNQVRSNDPPPHIGLTFVVKPIAISGEEFLAKVKAVWFVIAGWGRWSFVEDKNDDEASNEGQDEEDQEETDDNHLPSFEVLDSLPEWFQIALTGFYTTEASVKDWLATLYEREWTWWSGNVVGNYVKVDINTDSMPISTYPLMFLLEETGSKILYHDLWIDEATVKIGGDHIERRTEF